MSSKASKKAANISAQGADAAVDEQRRQYDLTRQDYQPWLETGRNALARLDTASTGDMSGFYASPDYNFRRSEGMRGIEQTAAARGGAYSGNALKALAEFNSNIASGEMGNWWNRQAGLAGVGQAATNAVGQFGANAAGNIGNALMASGDARASGVLGAANSLSGSLNSGINAYLSSRGGGWGGTGGYQTPPIRQNWSLGPVGFGGG